MSYTAEYTKPYEGGWQDSPSKETPVMAENLDNYDNVIMKIEEYLANTIKNDFAQLAEAGYSLGLDINENYVMTISLKNKAGTVISSKEIDFPIESMIINVEYDESTKILTLSLQNGQTLEVNISSIISGLVPDTRMIAGIDLKDDITKEELEDALGIVHDYVATSELILENSYEGTLEINEVGGVTELSGSNNLIQYDTPTEEVTVYGITFTPVFNDAGELLYINTNGTASDTYNDIWQDIGYVTLEAGKTYYISGCPSGGSEATYFLDTEKGYPRDYGRGASRVITETVTTRARICIMRGTTLENVKWYPMISEKPITCYEPYYEGEKLKSSVVNAITTRDDNGNESTVTLSEPVTLRGNGDSQDVIMQKDGVWGIERYFQVKTVTFLQSEARNALTNSKEIRTATGTVDDMSTVKYLCDKAAYVDTTWDVDEVGICSYGGTPVNQLTLRVAVDSTEDVEATIIYKATTSTFEELPTADQEALQILSTYNGTTYISFDSIVTPTANVTYPTSAVLGRLDDLEEELAELNGEVKGINGELKNAVLPKSIKATFSAAGWYRIAKISATTIAAITGSTPSGCVVQIARSYINNQPEIHRICMLSLYQKTMFVDEISLGINQANQLFTKIRHTVDETNLVAYIEVYYAGTSSNATSISLSNQRLSDGRMWELIVPEVTEETVEGITIFATHELSLNKSYESVETDLADFKLKALTPSGTATNIDTLYSPSTVMIVNDATEGTFPDGFDKVGLIEVIVRSDARTFQRYMDSSNQLAVRHSLTGGSWSDWDIKANKSDVDSLIAATYRTAIVYKVDNKEEALAQIDNPITIEYIGANGSCYCFLFTDTVGDSFIGGGVAEIEGYTYANGLYGVQTLKKWASAGNTIMKIRHQYNGTWTEWEQLAIQSDVTALQSNVSKLKYEWTTTIKCATWQRLCYVAILQNISGAKYLLNIKATRNGLVYNDTFLVTAHHTKMGSIVKISGNAYSAATVEYDVRIVVDANGNSYFEIYDDARGATSDTTQVVYCSLIPISTGTVTTYTESTDGTTLPSGFSVAKEMAVVTGDLQSDVTDALIDRLAYKNISSAIDVGETGITATAYTENGEVVVSLQLPGGTTSGTYSAQIDSAYAPRLMVAGNSIANLDTDANSVITSYVSISGAIYIKIANDLTNAVTCTFTYPLRTN